MYIFNLILIMFISISATCTYGADWRQCQEEGDKLFAHRNHEGEEATSIQGAITKYQEALAGVPKDKGNEKALSDIYLRLSRANFELAYYCLSDDDKVLQGYKDGIDYADKAIDINDKNGEAYFWRGVSTGSYRDKKKVSGVGGLFGGGIKKDFQRAIRLDEKCDYGGPHRFMAEFHLATDDTEDASIHAHLAVEIAPNYFYNQYVLAKVLWALGQKSQAIERLQYILSKGPDVIPDAAMENRAIIKATKSTLEDINNKKEPRWE